MFPGAQRQRVHGPRAQGSRSILPIPQSCSVILTALIPLHTTQTYSVRSAAGSDNSSSSSSTGGALGRVFGWPGAPAYDSFCGGRHDSRGCHGPGPDAGDSPDRA